MSYSQMSLLIGACLGAGLLLVWMSLWEGRPKTRTQRRWVREVDDMLTTAGFPRLHPLQLALVTVAVFIAAGIAALLGKKKAEGLTPTPERTVETVRRDAQDIKERI